MSTFSAALHLCGLSQQQAADYLGVRLDTIKNWSSGRSAVPGGVWGMLADLWQRIEDAADFAAINLDLDDPATLHNLQADTGADPLPSGADEAAGALALLYALSDDRAGAV